MAQLGGQNSGAPQLTPSQEAQILSAVKELDNSMTRMAAERDLSKAIVDKIFIEMGFPKKLLKKIAKTYYNSDFEMAVGENRDFEDTYETIVKKKNIVS